jgi:hypothetical protein
MSTTKWNSFLIMPVLFYFKTAIVFFELLACITGFVNLRNLQPPFWKLLPVFLLVIVACEIPGYILAFNNQMETNRNLYVFFVIPLEFLFYFWLLFKMTNKTHPALFVIGLLVYVAFFLTEYFFYPTIKSAFFLSVSYTTGNLVLLIFIFLYFLKLIKSNELLHFYKTTGFWVAAGLLIFWLGSFPYYGLMNFMWPTYKSIFLAYTWVVTFLNYFMYLSFILGFLCKNFR